MPFVFSCLPLRLPAMTTSKSKASTMRVPDWWPCEGESRKAPITHLYRAMRTDMKDLLDIPCESHHLHPDSDLMKVEVIRAVAEGSKKNFSFFACLEVFKGNVEICGLGAS